jgi:hypothetical protein
MNMKHSAKVGRGRIPLWLQTEEVEENKLFETMGMPRASTIAAAAICRTGEQYLSASYCRNLHDYVGFHVMAAFLMDRDK